MTDDAVVRADLVPGVTLIRLNRPDRLNAMSWDLLHGLHDELTVIEADPECRVVVLTGVGRAFCAGADLVDLAHDGDEADTPQSRLGLQKYIASLVLRIRDLPQPVIAAVNGVAVGGGFALALACDVRIIADTARFGTAFVKVGLSGCDIGVSWLLPRLIGASRAFELLLSGRTFDAVEADRLGLATSCVAPEDLMQRAQEVALSVLANSPMGVRLTKETMWSQLEVGSLRAGIDLENRTQVMATFTADHDEAVAAFVEKRAPRFADR